MIKQGTSKSFTVIVKFWSFLMFKVQILPVEANLEQDKDVESGLNKV
jgi:hypothetical protein